MKLLNTILNNLNEEPPKFESLDEGIDLLISNFQLNRFSKELEEHEFFINKRWLEIRNHISFQEAILHIFENNGQYLRILDGDISTGSWEYVYGGIAIKHIGQHQLYELAFLNENFFILEKHGNHSSKGNKAKYFVVVTEELSEVMKKKFKRNIEWIDWLKIMYNFCRDNNNYNFFVFGILFIILIIALLSII